jgi:Flp pilus assembly protein TadD
MDGLISLGCDLLRQGNIEQARDVFELARRAAPGQGRLLTLCGVALQRCGEAERAEERYREALGVCPDDADALTNLAELALARLGYAEALPLLRRAIAADPEYRHPSSQRARALTMRVVQQLG